MGGCILLKDKHAEKAPASALKGELLTVIPGDKLVPRSDRKRHHNYRLEKDETITVCAEIDDVAQLSDHLDQISIDAQDQSTHAQGSTHTQVDFNPEIERVSVATMDNLSFLLWSV